MAGWKLPTQFRPLCICMYLNVEQQSNLILSACYFAIYNYNIQVLYTCLYQRHGYSQRSELSCEGFGELCMKIVNFLLPIFCFQLPI